MTGMLWWTMLALAAPDAVDEQPSEAGSEAGAEAGEPGDASDTEQEPAGPDRSGPPEVIPAEVLQLPLPQVHDLGGGTEAWHVRVPDVRKVAVYVVLNQGTVELDGTWNFTNRAMGWMLDVAAGPHGSAELSELKDLNELDLWSSLSLHEGQVAMVVPRDGLELGLELQRMVLQEPAFPRKDLKRYLTDQRLFFTIEGPSSQRSIANSAVAYSWFPADHPYGTRPDLSGIDGVSPKALLQLHERWLGSGPGRILVVGDVAWSEVEAEVKALAAGLAASGELPQHLEVPTPSSRVLAVDMPGQEQVAIRMRMPAPAVDASERVAMRATNWVFGGNFLSRLNTNLREDKGFTYGARCSYRAGHTWGTATISVDVAVENLAATVHEIEQELQRVIDEGVSADELDGARRTLTSEWNQTLQTADSAVGLYRRALDERRTISELRDEVTALGDITEAAAQQVAQSWWGPEQPRIWVFVGDRAAVEAQLQQAGLEAQWVSPSDAILGNF